MTDVSSPIAPVRAEFAPRIRTHVLRFSALASGALLMALEILAFRIIGKTFGSALRETSVVIAVFLAAMSLGYYFGGRMVDRNPRMRTFSIVILLSAVAVLIVPALDDLISARVFDSGLPVGIHSFLVTIALFFTPTFFLASTSPIAVRLLADRVEHTGSVAGSLSAISTVGSIAGSLGTAFILIDAFQSIHRTIFALSFVAFGLAAATVLGDREEGGSRRWRWTLVAIGGGGALIVATVFVLNPVGGRILRSASQRVVYERDSAFHHIRVVDTSLRRVLYFDNTPQSAMKLDDAFSGGFQYTDVFHLPLALNPRAKRVLFLGIGGGTGPKAFARAYPNLEIDAVDVDPAVIEVAQQFFGLQPGARLRLYAADARAFVKRTNERYDTIVIDTYTQNRYGATIPAHLTTIEFFDECAAKLTDRGVIVFNSAFGQRSRLTAAVSRTMRRVFPYQAVFSEENSVLVASFVPLPANRAEFERVVDAAPRVPKVLRDRMAGLKEMDVSRAPILTDDYAPVDELVR